MTWKISFAKLGLIAALCVSGNVLFAGEKIEFSTSSDRPKIASEPRLTPNTDSKMFETSQPAIPNFVPMVPQQSAPNKRQDQEMDLKRNWIFARPEDHSALNDAKSDEKSLFSDEQKRQGVVGKFLEKSNSRDAKPNSRSDIFDAKNDKSDAFSSSFGNEQRQNSLEKLWGANNSENRIFNERNNSITDFWSTQNNPYDAAKTLRSTEAWEKNRNQEHVLAENANPFESFKTLQEANRPAAATPNNSLPTDYLNRTTQTSFQDQWKDGAAALSGGRPTAMEDVNSRALGANSSPSANRPTTEIAPVKQQPAVLQFPSRPGSVFR